MSEEAESSSDGAAPVDRVSLLRAERLARRGEVLVGQEATCVGCLAMTLRADDYILDRIQTRLLMGRGGTGSRGVDVGGSSKAKHMVCASFDVWTVGFRFCGCAGGPCR